MKKLILISTAAMMMTSFCASAKKEKQTKIVNPADMEIRREIAATPEKSGGIYYAYPYSTDSLAPVPAGFEPVYISPYAVSYTHSTPPTILRGVRSLRSRTYCYMMQISH